MVQPPRFHVRKTQENLRLDRSGVKWLIVLAVMLAVWLAIEDYIHPPEPVSVVEMRFGLCGDGGSHAACVIDGDTLAIGPRRVRLTGYDAPELGGTCEAERSKAREARTALHTWLAKGRFNWTGGANPPRDQYGRELREARRGDEALADAMVEAGLAEGSGWGAEARDWCP